MILCWVFLNAEVKYLLNIIPFQKLFKKKEVPSLNKQIDR